MSLSNFADNTLDVDYQYGSTVDPLYFTKGRLKQIIRNPAGTPITLDFKYDRFGRTTQDGDLARTFDKNGNLWTLTYPEGLVATYGYDFADREQTLYVNPGTGAQNIVTASVYKANGPLSSLTFATTPTARTETRAFDARYLPNSIDVTGSSSLFHWDYQKDDVGNVTTITQTVPTGTPVRSFGYQDYQYFLSVGSGPWGTWLWTYDKIGNRLTQGLQNYTYQQNAASTGSTARLTSVCVELGPSCPVLRAYTSDAAGYLDTITAGANLIDFSFDAAGQLANVDRGVKNHLVNSYDGRGFLKSASEFANGAYVNATYSSRGLLHSLERLPAVGGTLERHNALYFAGRPVAIWKKVGTAAATTTYLTTDHLGTPIFALNQTGTEYWKGGLEPFGRDYQEGTANDMLAKGIFFRFPGQWDDAAFSNSTLGADIYYNVHRWYEPQTGRYTRVDPLAVATGIDIFSYANDNPLSQTDSLGLRPALDCCGLAKARGLFGSAGGTVICCSGTKVPCIDIPAFSTDASPVARATLQDCATKHEKQHFGDVDCPPCGITSPPFRNGEPQQAESECKASRVEWKCLVAKRSQCGSDVACREALRLREVQVQNYGGSFGKPCTF